MNTENRYYFGKKQEESVKISVNPCPIKDSFQSVGEVERKFIKEWGS
jgi:hypothetical protein